MSKTTTNEKTKKIKDAKLTLYLLLLGEDKLSNIDIEIAYQLSRDPFVKEFFQQIEDNAKAKRNL